MNPVTKNQIITINTLLTKLGLQDDKARIITEASGGRCSSTSGILYEEAEGLINFLNASHRVTTPGTEDSEDGKGQRMKKHIIAMAHELGWVKKQRVVALEQGMRLVNNYDDLNSWMIKYGYLHKPLAKYKYKELPTLVTQFKAVFMSKMKSKQ